MRAGNHAASTVSGLALTNSGVGFSAPDRRNSAILPADIVESRQKRPVFTGVWTDWVVWILPLLLASIDVFRAALVSIVLTLTLGQNAALLCSVWCHPQQDATSTCEHQVPMTFPGVTGNESCIQVAAELTALVREDARRAATGSHAQQGTVVARFPLLPPSTTSARDLERAQAPPPAARPLLLALRI